MNALNRNDMNILDLPDEILLFIFNKLNVVSRFYSLVDINERIDRLILDPLYVQHLEFVIEQDDTSNSSKNAYILDRISKTILPQINEEVNKLTVDQFSMEHIVDAIDHTQLHTLALVNYHSNILFQYLKDNNMYHRLLNRITNLTVNTYSEKTYTRNPIEAAVSLLIFTLGLNLRNLTFTGQCPTEYLTVWYPDIVHIDCLSSTLTNLTINVRYFNDCLYLLNGSLPSLSTLFIRIECIYPSSSSIDKKTKLVKLKCFSLVSRYSTSFYDTEVVPLLQRMLNLEELILFITVQTRTTYIDGNQLNDGVLSYMPRLNKFVFSIHSRIIKTFDDRGPVALQSNADIRNSFIKQGIRLFDMCADEKLIDDVANCRVYSLPYGFHEFLYMGNGFQGGKFDKVRILLMYDIRPFEYELFEIISRHFPFIQELSVLNERQEKSKQHISSRLITFNHLLKLDLYCAHGDYALQLLSYNYTRLPCLTNLKIGYESLLNITNHFTNDMIRSNCVNIKSLVTCQSLVGSQNFYSYFPSVYRS